MDIRLRGRSRIDGKSLFYHNAIAEVYHDIKTGSLMGFAGYDGDKPILLDMEIFTGFIDINGVEIWEGDTVTYAKSAVFSVVWDEEKGCWSLEDDHSMTPMAPLAGQLEVGQ